MKVVLITMIVIVFFTIAMLFSVSNEAMVDLNYLIGHGNFNVSHLIGLSFLSGFIICWILAYTIHLKLKVKLSFLRKKLNKLELKDSSVALKDKA